MFSPRPLSGLCMRTSGRAAQRLRATAAPSVYMSVAGADAGNGSCSRVHGRCTLTIYRTIEKRELTTQHFFWKVVNFLVIWQIYL